MFNVYIQIFLDPSPIDLIAKFHEVILETLRNRPEIESDIINVEQDVETKQLAKSLALKILSLKVAAFLKWNLGKVI